ANDRWSVSLQCGKKERVWGNAKNLGPALRLRLRRERRRYAAAILVHPDVHVHPRAVRKLVVFIVERRGVGGHVRLGLLQDEEPRRRGRIRWNPKIVHRFALLKSLPLQRVPGGKRCDPLARESSWLRPRSKTAALGFGVGQPVPD